MDGEEEEKGEKVKEVNEVDFFVVFYSCEFDLNCFSNNNCK